MSNPDDGADATNPSSPVCAVEMESLNDVKCEDVDLLSVSCKLADLSTDVVGQCLGLQESQIQNAFKRVTDRHHDHNKVHLLLIKWREVKGEATWGALLRHLQSLPDPQIAENIKDESLRNPQVSKLLILRKVLHLEQRLMTFTYFLLFQKHKYVFMSQQNNLG